LNVFGHDSHSFGVNGAQVGVFKQTDQVGFTGFLLNKYSQYYCLVSNLHVSWEFPDESHMFGLEVTVYFSSEQRGEKVPSLLVVFVYIVSNSAEQKHYVTV